MLLSYLRILLFCLIAATPASLAAKHATIRVSGTPDKIGYEATRASSDAIERVLEMHPLKWIKENRDYEYGVDIPLVANQAQRVGIEFTPTKSGTVTIHLRGPYNVDADYQQQIILTYWCSILIEGARPLDEFPLSGMDGWTHNGTPESWSQGSFGRTQSPDWLTATDEVYTLSHYAFVSRKFEVTAGEPVRLAALVAYEDRETDFDAVYRSPEAVPPITLQLSNGETAFGVPFDRDAQHLYLRPPFNEPISIPLDQVHDLPSWRSELYPENWTPALRTEKGEFLHDFSYAGYQRGEAPLPEITSPIVDLTASPYHADNSGHSDVAEVLQRAIDELGAQGGGVIYLPAGTYRLDPEPSKRGGKKKHLIRIAHDNIVLRGDGPDATFIFNNSYQMNDTSIFEVRSDAAAPWYKSKSVEMPLTSDLPRGVFIVPLKDSSPFKVGDTVILREDLTDARIQELDMQQHWISWGKANPTLCRDIVAVDHAANTVTLDAPTRQPVQLRDKARLYKINPLLSDIGFESFSIGNREHPQAYTDGVSGYARPLKDTANHSDWLDGDRQHNDSVASYHSTTSFVADLHGSYLIWFDNARDSWIRDVDTYRPAENTRDTHLLSNGFILNESRNITVQDCDLANPVFIGGGGNGYLISLGGPDNLIRDCTLTRARHPFSSRGPQTSGNVYYNVRLNQGGGADWHMQLSPANLADNVTCDGTMMEAWCYRGRHPYAQHGHTTTETVFWNTRGLKYPDEVWFDNLKPFIIDSGQYGNGYIIGTRGPAPDVRVDAPAFHGLYGKDATPEWVEGIGQGATLEPQSLYLDQLRRRLKEDRP